MYLVPPFSHLLPLSHVILTDTMRIASSIRVAACLSITTLPLVCAFYPYKPKYGDETSDEKSQRRALLHTSEGAHAEHTAITLPLRRVPTRRDNKYTIVKSKEPTQKNSAAIDQDGPDWSYMVGVTIGSSTEEYHLLLDSAASNTWVMGQECKTAACGTHNTFGDQDSSSLKV